MEFIESLQKHTRARQDFWYPRYHVSDERIIASLRRNPELLRMVRLKNENSTYQFINSTHTYGETLFTRAIMRRDGNAAFFHQLLDIAENELDQQTVKRLVTLSTYSPADMRHVQPAFVEVAERAGDPLVDACQAGDDVVLFKRMAHYSNADWSNLETRKKMIKAAVRNNCPSILRYLRDELHFDRQDFDSVIVPERLYEPSPEMVIFLLDDMGIDPNRKITENNYRGEVVEFQLFEQFLTRGGFLLNAYTRSKVEDLLPLLTTRVIGVVIALLERGANFTAAQADHFMKILQAKNNTEQNPANAEKTIESGNIAYLQGLITEKRNGKIAAEKYYEIARTCNNYKMDARFIRNKIKEIRETANPQNQAELFDQLYAQYKLARTRNANQEELLSVSDAWFLVSVGQSLPAKLVQLDPQKQSPVDVRGNAIKEFLQYIDSVPAASLTEKLKQFKKMNDESLVLRLNVFSEICRLIMLPNIRLQECLSAADAYYLRLTFSAEEWLWEQPADKTKNKRQLSKEAQDKKILRENAQEKLLNYIDSIPADAFREQLKQFKSSDENKNPVLHARLFDELCRLIILPEIKPEKLLSVEDACYLFSLEKVRIGRPGEPRRAAMVRDTLREKLSGYFDTMPVASFSGLFNELKTLEKTGQKESVSYVALFDEMCRLYGVAIAHGAEPDELLSLEDTLHLLSIEHFIPAGPVASVEPDREKMRKELTSCIEIVPVDSLRIQLGKLKNMEKTKEQNPELYIYLFDEICRLYETISWPTEDVLSLSDALYLLKEGQFLGRETETRTKACEKWLAYINSKPLFGLGIDEQFKWLWEVDFTAYTESAKSETEDKTDFKVEPATYYLHGRNYYLQNLKHACRLYAGCKYTKDAKEAYDLICHFLEISPFEIENKNWINSVKGKPVLSSEGREKSLSQAMIGRCIAHLDLDFLQPEQKQIFKDAFKIFFLAEFEHFREMKETVEENSVYYIRQFDEICQLYEVAANHNIQPDELLTPGDALHLVREGQALGVRTEVRAKACEKWLEYVNTVPVDSISNFRDQFEWLSSIDFTAHTTTTGGLEDPLDNEYKGDDKAWYLQVLRHACHLYEESGLVDQKKEAYGLICRLIERSPCEIENDHSATVSGQKETRVQRIIDRCHAHLRLDLQPEQRQIILDVQQVLIDENINEQRMRSLQQACDEYQQGNHEEKIETVKRIFDLLPHLPFIFKPSASYQGLFAEADSRCRQFLESTPMPTVGQCEMVQHIRAKILPDAIREWFLKDLKHYSSFMTGVDAVTDSSTNASLANTAETVIDDLHDLLKVSPFKVSPVLPGYYLKDKTEEIIELCHNHLDLSLPEAQQEVFQGVLTAVLEAKKHIYIKKLADACKLYADQPAEGLVRIEVLMQVSPFDIASQGVLPGDKMRSCLAHLKLPLSVRQKKAFDTVAKILLREDAREKELYFKKLREACHSWEMLGKTDYTSRIFGDLCALVMDSPFIKQRAMDVGDDVSFTAAMKCCREHLAFLDPSSSAIKVFQKVESIFLAKVKKAEDEKEKASCIEKLENACASYRESSDPAVKNRQVDEIYRLIKTSPFLETKMTSSTTSTEEGTNCCLAHLKLPLTLRQKSAFDDAMKIFVEVHVAAEPYKAYKKFKAAKQERENKKKSPLDSQSLFSHHHEDPAKVSTKLRKDAPVDDDGEGIAKTDAINRRSSG